MPKKVAESGKDRFGDLSDDLIRHVLSFLPPCDTLQTCVLDTRWRDHWRRTTDILDIFDMSLYPTRERTKQLVKLFIHLRGNSPIDKCKIDAFLDDNGEEESAYTNTLIQYALDCQVKELVLVISDDYFFAGEALSMPLISQHLKTIRFESVKLECSVLNFSRCPVLEDLKMQYCRIQAHRISSKSLKRLCITDFCSFPADFHTRIFVPELTSVQLDGFDGFPPILEYMPFLATAYVELRDTCHSIRREGCGCDACHVVDGVLNGFSAAVNLELIAETGTFTGIWYSEWCPIFDKLKSLLLNECVMTIDLVCILKHTPVLEVLTLQLGNTETLIGATGSQETIEQPFVCAHLEVVNIECRKVDEGIHNILNILSTCGIPPEKISMKDLCSYSCCFSFQKPHQPLLLSTAAPVSVYYR